MKEIALNRGLVMQVDDEDFEWVSQRTWCAYPSGNTFYVRHRFRGKGRVYHGSVALHRELLDARPSEFVDHIDGNGLNNQRNNLRLCTKRQNCRNRRKGRNNTTGFKGVTWRELSRKFQARIQINGKEKNLGLYTTAEEAARVYDEAAKKHYGEFAATNF